ncbi:MAG: EscU/YscU/HrcU family type III secretion system export apparatus switch protein [Treponema sp.]|nr:EscU/YscU/HrcU family type III secretion system export apparatus switch protein [Treponema sp.]
MAAEDEGRTEEPSEYKLEKERKEGRVAKTQELAGSLVLLFTVLLLFILGKRIFNNCAEIMIFCFNQAHEKDPVNGNLWEAFLNFFLRIILPMGVVSFIAALAGNIIQTRGFLFSWKPIEPKFSKILPKFGEYFRRTIGSLQGLFNIAKSLGKVALIVFIAYLLIRRNMWDIVETISTGSIISALRKVAMTGAELIIIVSVLFVAIAIPDYFVQRHEFMESLKMTKQEVKEEFKEMEGDPQMKAQLRAMQQRILSQNIPKAVKESNVVITNPTHFSVALKYDEEAGNNAPVVNAKGMDNEALLIRRIATENDIPLVENKPLARDLYQNIDVGEEVPPVYWKTIALIYSQLAQDEKTDFRKK